MRQPLTVYGKHKQEWLGCTRCLLHEHRKKVVLCRGKIPADVLFIGEAPGESEDVLGSPFVGPAGLLLDGLIESAFVDVRIGAGHFQEFGGNPDSPVDWSDGRELRVAFSNLTGCIPHNEEGNKYHLPKEAIKACRPRLIDLCKIIKPKLVVQVGVLAKKHWDKKDWEAHISPTKVPVFVKIDHPAFIIREENDKGEAVGEMMKQRCVITLSGAAERVFSSGG